MQLQIRSEAETSPFIHVPDQISQKHQPFGQWAKKPLETQSEESSLKVKSKSFWRAKGPCLGAKSIMNEVRSETSVGPYTLLETTHTSGSNQWIKFFLDEGLWPRKPELSLGGPGNLIPGISNVWGKDIWANTQLNSKNHHHIQPIPCNLLSTTSPMPGLTWDATTLFPPAKPCLVQFLSHFLSTERIGKSQQWLFSSPLSKWFSVLLGKDARLWFPEFYSQKKNLPKQESHFHH